MSCNKTKVITTSASGAFFGPILGSRTGKDRGPVASRRSFFRPFFSRFRLYFVAVFFFFFFFFKQQ